MVAVGRLLRERQIGLAGLAMKPLPPATSDSERKEAFDGNYKTFGDERQKGGQCERLKGGHLGAQKCPEGFRAVRLSRRS